MKEQKELINRHLDKHKWYRGISEKTEGMLDFISRYGEILREFFCDTACPNSTTCESYQTNFKKQNLRRVEDIPQAKVSLEGISNCPYFSIFIDEQKELLKRHLENHKWLNGIGDTSQATNDFLNRYQEVIFEMFCDVICPIENCKTYEEHLKKNGFERKTIIPKVNGKIQPKQDLELVAASPSF
jgi:hypothetical protein